MTPYAWPVYAIRLEFGGREVASAFGLDGVRAAAPYLHPELYSLHVGGPRGWRRVGSVARYRTGAWSVALDDGREFHGRIEPDPADFIV